MPSPGCMSVLSNRLKIVHGQVIDCFRMTKGSVAVLVVGISESKMRLPSHGTLTKAMSCLMYAETVICSCRESVASSSLLSEFCIH